MSATTIETRCNRHGVDYCPDRFCTAKRDELARRALGPMFTFTTSSSSPAKRVRCHHCGWEVKGGKGTFEKADRHVCKEGPRAGLQPHESTVPEGQEARA